MNKYFALFLLFLFVACSSANTDRSDSQSYPIDLRIELGEGGGFTGLWNGYAIDSAGGVEELSGRTLGASRRPAGKVSPEILQSIWDRIASSGVLTEAHSPETGNMTRSMTITAHGTTTRFFWVPPSMSNPPATKVDDVFMFLMRTVGKKN